MHSGTEPAIVSVNVGLPREVTWRGRTVLTAIWKTPVGTDPVWLRGVNLVGDDQADRSVHGGPDKAVYAYAAEDYQFWSQHHSLETVPGLFGENLTVEGVDLSATRVGERWQVGSSVLEIAQPRLPCFKLGIRLNDQHFLKVFLNAGRPGAYLRIVEEGQVRAGDVVTVISRPSHDVTVGLMNRAMTNRELAPALLAADQLPDSWRRWALGETGDG
ncbi:MAG: MOSC domain-containing protein [Gemmatimonadota bacterium]